MWSDWEAKRLEVAWDGQKVGTVSCEVRRQRAFGFAPRLRAEARCVLDFTELPPDVARPTRASSFTLAGGGTLFGQRDGWRVKELRDEGGPGRERLWLLLETC
jgi:hypothetical protein